MSAQLAGASTHPAPNNTTGPENASPSIESWNARKDGGVIVGLVALVAAVFWKTVFHGEPISRIARLATWDSAFAQYSHGASALMDPSVVQLTVPYFMLVAKLWHLGQVPLWNPYNACGVPLLADPQAFVLEPVHSLMALFPTMQCYNFVLVTEIAIGVVSTFVLARSINASRVAAVLAGLAYAFCPLNQWFVEQLGNGYFLFPLTFWLFVRASLKPTVRRAAAAGVGCAILVLSGHPESVFYGTAFGALLSGGLILSDAGGTAQSLLRRVWLAVRQVAIAATVAGFLCAPLLLPFAEYLKNADCYKFGDQVLASISWQLLLINLLQPSVGGASLYLGILPVLCLPFCFIGLHSREKRLVAVLAAVALIAELVTSRFWLVNAMVKHTPLASLIPTYCQPISLLLITLLGAYGFSRLTDGENVGKRKQLIIAAVAVAMLAVPLAMSLAHVQLASLSFDASLTDVGLNLRDWRLDALLTVAIALILATQSLWRSKAGVLPLIAVVALNFVGQFSVARHALPVNPKFDYGPTPVTDELSQAPGRSIALGDHLLKANNNCVYRINDLRIHNPMFPAGFRDLVNVCGGQTDQFNQNFTAPLSPRLGIAAVNRVVSLGPVWTVGVTDGLKMQSSQAACRWQDAEVTEFSSAYDAANKQVIGKLRWRLQNLPNLQDLSYSMVLIDRHGATIWFSDGQPLAPIAEKHRKGESATFQSVLKRDFAVAIPPATKDDAGPYTVGVQVCNWKTIMFEHPTGGHVLQDRICELFSFSTGRDSQIEKVSDPTFKLVKEISPTLRFYENLKALPQAYTVNSIANVASREDAISAIQRSDFAFGKRAVFETSTPLACSQRVDGAVAVQPVAFLTRKSPTEVDIVTGNGDERALVLTDTYYPGWQASVDGSPVKTYRANGYFRGIVLPAGEHTVQFKYDPISFKIGLALAAAMSLLLIAAALTAARDGVESVKRSEDQLAAQ
ncbi:MAG TPA: YfhO family protein [Planktothrix sp.]